MSKRAQIGVTLPEVMISLLIFALIASASVYALRLGVDSREQLGVADSRLKNLQIARTLIKEDMAQIVPRQVRDEYGGVSSAAFAGGQTVFAGRVEDDEKILVAFTRGGWLNPRASSPRSALQRVEYIFKGNTVVRRTRVYLDEAPNTEFAERVLFDGVEDARAEFLIGEFRGELDWGDVWPTTDQTSGAPRAIAIIVDRGEETPLRQLFWIGDLGA